MTFRNCGPLCPDSTGILLDLPVRTDTKGVSRGSKGVVSDPFRFVRCSECGVQIDICRCSAVWDY